MALHRDIFWVGKQWAVTGYGVQACDQKQKSKFDIEVDRVWDDGLLESLRAHKWLNVEDLEKALSVARQRFPEPPRKPTKSATVEPSAATRITEIDIEPSQPAVPKFHMLFSGAAKFIRPWRVRIRK
jgi:hypothetical protein